MDTLRVPFGLTDIAAASEADHEFVVGYSEGSICSWCKEFY